MLKAVLTPVLLGLAVALVIRAASRAPSAMAKSPSRIKPLDRPA